MRLLGRLCLLSVLGVMVVTTLGSVEADPPDDPDHGVNETLFPLLWSADHDRFVNESVYFSKTGETRTPLEVIANATDIPFDQPPKAVEQWNSGEFELAPETNPSVSIGPPGANRSKGAFIEDAFVSIFAIQPSTRALLTPTEQPLYVGDSGTVLALVDYRVDVRDNRTDGDTRYRYRFDSHRVRQVRLLIDDQVEDSTTDTQRPLLEFDSLGSYPGNEHELTVEADIRVVLERTIQTCLSPNRTTDECTKWHNETQLLRSTHTVSTSRTVEEYYLSIAGSKTQFPDGDVGLLITKRGPWVGMDTPAGNVRDNWRFFSARKTSWDTLDTHSTDAVERNHSPIHPLQVYAFPISVGPISRSPLAIDRQDVRTVERPAPTLPAHVRLDVAKKRYNESSRLVYRIDSAHTGRLDASDWTALGLVRGVNVSFDDALFRPRPTYATDLELSVEAIDDGVALLEVSLVDSRGRPVDTSIRPETIWIEGRQIDTGPDGTAIATIPVGDGIISGRFEADPWYETSPGLVSDSDLVYATESSIDVVGAVSQIVVPIALILFAAFLLDRITGIPIWPPWRI